MLQPNFSLARLASNAALAYSDREFNWQALEQDSLQALSALPQTVRKPTLLIWPESTFPYAFFKHAQAREIVQKFAREQHTAILLSSLDWEKLDGGGKNYFSFSLLLDELGQVAGRYDKIFLIPFGETVPGASQFPAYRDWLRKQIPNMSEFTAGTKYSVFQLSNGVKFSASICFDVFAPQIVRNMAHDGAQLIVNLSNLAWFGKTNASEQMKMMTYWQAITFRVPIVVASNNGESYVMSSAGKIVSKTLELFVVDTLSTSVRLDKSSSLQRDYFWLSWTLALCGLGLFGSLELWRRRLSKQIE